jgi:hypothetical protein
MFYAKYTNTGSKEIKNELSEAAAEKNVRAYFPLAARNQTTYLQLYAADAKNTAPISWVDLESQCWDAESALEPHKNLLLAFLENKLLDTEQLAEIDLRMFLNFMRALARLGHNVSTTSCIRPALFPPCFAGIFYRRSR